MKVDQMVEGRTIVGLVKYDKQDQQGKAALNERHPNMTKRQEPG
jgi:hypothetical protein